MSIVHCEFCGQYIDTDFDVEHFTDHEQTTCDPDITEVEDELNNAAEKK